MQQNNFDFNGFNSLTNGKPAGLQIFLAQQLLSNALWQMEKYSNPREQDVRDIFNEVKTLRTRLKADAEARAKAE
jgi:predicted SprT family Zn-dependent metalloprotease